VGFVGSFTTWHGLDHLLHGIAATNPSVHLVLVGDGPTRPSMETLARKLDIHDRVHFVGRVSREQVPTYLAGFHVGAILKDPSVPGDPIKLYEYLAAGLPVVATKSVDFETVNAEGVAELCDPSDPTSVASAIERWQDSGRWTAAHKKARNLVEGKYSWARIVERTEAIYAEIASQGGG
jgi:glycosyltransferase involved in cell wall biosynthesis